MTDPKEKTEKLTFTATSPDRTKMGRLRQLFDEIDAAKRAGWRHDKILEELRNQSFEMTPQTFADALMKIRKERSAAKDVSAQALPERTSQKEPVQTNNNTADKPDPKTPHESSRGVTKEGYRQPLQTFVRDVTKRRDWDGDRTKDLMKPNDTTAKRDHISKEGYRDPLPTFFRDVTKRINLDE